mmetsp:Transcript_86408/g.241850  ORF Transcript_86408/g.241850 Transcript_86408/m.241850 type:complete len:356 (-) Transcript_86408:3-1070(-)
MRPVWPASTSEYPALSTLRRRLGGDRLACAHGPSNCAVGSRDVVVQDAVADVPADVREPLARRVVDGAVAGAVPSLSLVRAPIRRDDIALERPLAQVPLREVLPEPALCGPEDGVAVPRHGVEQQPQPPAGVELVQAVHVVADAQAQAPELRVDNAWCIAGGAPATVDVVPEVRLPVVGAHLALRRRQQHRIVVDEPLAPGSGPVLAIGLLHKGYAKVDAQLPCEVDEALQQRRGAHPLGDALGVHAGEAVPQPAPLDVEGVEEGLRAVPRQRGLGEDDDAGAARGRVPRQAPHLLGVGGDSRRGAHPRGALHRGDAHLAGRRHGCGRRARARTRRACVGGEGPGVRAGVCVEVA